MSTPRPLLPGVVARQRDVPLMTAEQQAEHRAQLLAELQEIQRRGREQRRAARAARVREPRK